jgi:GWxTD domain-containing protein
MSKRLIALFLFIGISTSLFAQRVSYRQLVMRSQSPTIFIDDIILPGDEGKATLAFIFRFNNDFIPYKKLPLNNTMDAPDGAEFYSTIRLNNEIFEGKLNRRRPPSANSVSRDVWTDTLFTANFEETQSAKKYASGYLSSQLSPGNYNFILQLAMMQEINERSTTRQGVTIPDLSAKEDGEILLIKSQNNNQLELMNMEDNVPFGQDFTALIRIPNYSASDNYEVKVNRARTSRKDTTSGNNLYSSDLDPQNIFTNSTVKLTKKDRPTLELVKENNPYTYAVVKIPASTFENAPYFLSVVKKGSDEPVARKFFRSYWPDMPASLYNLDVAIENLHYIASEKEIERINQGNDRKREEKFRAFWDSKDPTPKTVYNELMAEYYRRIDYAFKEYGSQENPMGHESDQGEVYIKFGPPSDKERRFPEQGKTVEVWKYPSRTFVFEASTGFGDFVLVGTR